LSTSIVVNSFYFTLFVKISGTSAYIIDTRKDSPSAVKDPILCKSLFSYRMTFKDELDVKITIAKSNLMY
jgi:hypothetical protein